MQKVDLKSLSLDDLNKERLRVIARLEELRSSGPAIKEHDAYLSEIIVEWNTRTGQRADDSSAGKRARKSKTATVEEITAFVRDYLDKNKVSEVGASAIRKHFDALDTSSSGALDDAARGDASRGIKPTLKLRQAGRGKDGGNFYSLLDAPKATEKTGQEQKKDGGEKAKGK